MIAFHGIRCLFYNEYPTRRIADKNALNQIDTAYWIENIFGTEVQMLSLI